MRAEKACPSNKKHISDFLKVFISFCLRCCTWAFFSCSEWVGWRLLSVVCRLLTAGASLVVEPMGFSSCGIWALVALQKVGSSQTRD